jgi:hypothetical protein
MNIVISGFRRGVNEICDLLGSYAVHNFSVSDVSGQPLGPWTTLTLNIALKVYPETSLKLPFYGV